MLKRCVKCDPNFYSDLLKIFRFKSYLLASPSARPWCFISWFLKSSNPMVVLSPTQASSHIALVRSLNSLESKFIPFSSIEAFKASINSFWCNLPFPATNLTRQVWDLFQELGNGVSFGQKWQMILVENLSFL